MSVCNVGIYGYAPKQVEVFFGTKVTMEDNHFVVHGVHRKETFPLGGHLTLKIFGSAVILMHIPETVMQVGQLSCLG